MAMSIDDQGYAEEEGDGTLTDRRNSLERAENLEQKQREKELQRIQKLMKYAYPRHREMHLMKKQI